MRGFWVTWSPDGLASEGVRTRPDARSSEARNMCFKTIYSYSQMTASGKPREEGLLRARLKT